MAGGSVLLLGAGFVTRPTAQILADNGLKVTVACRTLDSAKKLAEGLKNAHPISLDVTKSEALDAEVAKNDLVISLIPYTFHATVIKSAIRNKKNVVTTSYVSPAMMELDKEAKEAGITVMNEIGLDPGIDHLYAVKTIDEVHKAGGKVTGFLSYCGGLPAPEASDNPLGYKFSWSSRGINIDARNSRDMPAYASLGVLLALRNPAKYYKDGKVVDVKSAELMGTAKPYHIYPGYAFVAYPNRDSTPYRERYSMPEAQTIIRGTLRYAGFPEFVRTLVDIGFLSDEERDFLKTGASKLSWKEATAKILGATSQSEDDLIWAISSKTSFANTEEKERIIAGLRWVGLFSDEEAILRGNPLDTLCATLEKKMQYEPGERDMVLLQHKFEIENKDGSKETRTSTLVEYADPKGQSPILDFFSIQSKLIGNIEGYSAMAKLVGVPCAVAVMKVLDGTIKQKGILAPMTPELNNPIMKELKEKYGIEMKEKVIS
ncbi:MAG: Saccharopine dehydrogenase [NADP(+), L-glutamate-forming] [Piccolia ochrophora]|nr:MAG: Saccharopine dehydrogenase [NADP(+), L-glutamate-forming] [Piccolia ochrophora]